MTTEAETIADLARAGETIKEPVIVHDDAGRAWLFAPEGLTKTEVTDPDRAIAKPFHIRQGVTVQTVDSLVDYANGFKTGSTIMFADIAANKITALLDYHKASDGAVSGAADHLFHRADMVLPFSEEWKLWTGVSGKMMEQLEFARFLEENSVDIVAPTGAELLEIVHDLHAVRKVDFRKAVRTATDNENFEYSEETETRAKGGGSIEIPSKFRLALPVYFGDPPTEVHAFLRWRLEEAKLKLGIVLHRAEHVRQAVFKQIVLDVAHRVERQAVFGRPV